MSRYERTDCRYCHQSFAYRGNAAPATCGRGLCRAKHDWDAAAWSARADMAEARAAAGLTLSDWDREALARTGRTAA